MVLEPRIPVCKYNCEDSEIKRICVSQSINGCLTAIGSRFDLGDKVYIHQCESDNVIQPTSEQVKDVHLTGEQWILEPIAMTLLYTIIILGTLNSTIKGVCNVLYAFRLEYDEYDMDRKEITMSKKHSCRMTATDGFCEYRTKLGNKNMCLFMSHPRIQRYAVCSYSGEANGCEHYKQIQEGIRTCASIVPPLPEMQGFSIETKMYCEECNMTPENMAKCTNKICKVS